MLVWPDGDSGEAAGPPEVRLNTRDCHGWTPMMRAAHRNHVETVRVMAGDGRVELDTVDSWGRTLEGVARSVGRLGRY
jgi:hypothetical protein